MSTPATSRLSCLLAAAMVVARALAADAPPRPSPDRMAWFNEARFGLFIHWGPYAVIAGEWKGKQSPNIGEWAQLQFNIPGPEYEAVARTFNPTKFNAEQWVRTAKAAGQRYIVFTTKHHDGFCMWHTRQTRYNIYDVTPFKRDPLKELADACKKEGMRLGLYYSLVDWHHPEFPPKYSNQGKNFHGFPNPDADISKYADYQIAQVKELLTGYGPIGVMWFDAGGAFRNADRYGLLRGDEMIATIRRLQPDCLINNRIGGDKGDYGTPEQKIPGTIQDQAFETCMTMGKKWGYNKFDTNLKSATDLTRNLIDIASKGGNFLLNVGPTAEGEFTPAQTERLLAIGRWLKTNGQCIYGTRNSLFPNLPFGRSTTRLLDDGNTRVYLEVFDWPKDGRLLAPGISNKPLRAFLPAEGPDRLLNCSASPAGVTVTGLPAEAPDKTATVIVLDVEGKPAVAAPRH